MDVIKELVGEDPCIASAQQAFRLLNLNSENAFSLLPGTVTKCSILNQKTLSSAQNIQHDDDSHEPMSNADKGLAHTMSKSTSYKARLIFQDSKEPIGDFMKEDTHVACIIHMDKHKQWQSTIRIDIKAFLSKESPVIVGSDITNGKSAVQKSGLSSHLDFIL